MKESLQGIKFHRELGEGSLSLVYLVTLPGKSKKVVLKLCKYQTTPDYRSTGYCDERHGGEMLGINFQHPNVMKTLGVLTLNSKRQIEWINNSSEKQTAKGMILAVVQEYVPGAKELFDYIVDNRIQNTKQIHYIANSIACALYYLHKECNIAHRDIKPENVLIGDNSEVKVIDFSFLVRKERTKSQCGSPAYLAPEIMVADENAYDPKLADTFSFATLLFLIRFGESPWFTLEMDDMAAHLDLLLSFYHGSANLAKYFPENSKPVDELDGHLFDLIGKLGTGKPEERLSLVEALETHPYFASLWKKKTKV